MPARMGLRFKHALWLAMAAVVVVAVGAWYVLPVEDWIEDFTAWIASLGKWGIVAFGAIYVVATLLLAPGSVMSIAAGVAFGYWGLPFVLVSATTGAALAFLIARYAAHDGVSALLEDKPKFKAIGKAIDEQGWKIVALVRLSPQVPFAVTNYFFGVTNVGFWPFVITTIVGVAPATFVYVNIGMMGRAAAGGGVDTMRWIMLVVGLVAAVAAGVLIARKAKEKLRDLAEPAQVPS
jgi:uncharacterized membrane protein YdjX (TVP38/TMEM64 family)